MQNPIHAAIIMDGNGRWARRRSRPRTAGHREGAKAVSALVEHVADPAHGVRWLTLYAFSSDNWTRPPGEVRALMRLFGEYLRREVPRMVENGIRLEVVGRRDRLTPGLVDRMAAAESATSGGDGLRLRLAIDYSARDQIVRAAAALREEGVEGGSVDRESFRRRLAAAGRPGGAEDAAPDVDLLIRTGGEQRLSDFLLWECAYAELYFTPILWPDFTPAAFEAAVSEYRRRDRRFGQVLEEAV
jgi:undecaprenyl diphosphate synthase